MRLCMLIIALWFVGMVDGAVTIRGTVVNQAAKPVVNAQVSLTAAAKSVVTDQNGVFSITLNSVDLLGGAQRSMLRRVQCDGKHVVFALDRGPQRVGIDIYNAAGAWIAGAPPALLPAGEHRLPVAGLLRGLTAPSFCVLVATVGAASYRFRLVGTGNEIVASPLQAGAQQQQQASLARRYAVAAMTDVMVVKKDSSGEAVFSVGTKQDADLYIPLDLIPYETVRYAVLEVGRYPDEVGKDITFDPYDLARYLSKIGDGVHDYEAWCSEFASWVYRVSGFPLSGGSQGGWMISGSTQLRSWFQTHAQFVNRDHSQWATFVPRAGDYVRYDNSSGGHSGIVRYSSGQDLYTVEGNVSNRCALRRIADWRNYSASSGTTRIDGIGMRSRAFDDLYEPNNTSATAYQSLQLGKDYANAAISPLGDEDWYRFVLGAAGTISVSLLHDEGRNLDWQLYRAANLTAPAASGASAANPEFGSLANAAAGTYYVKVTGNGGRYILTIR